jgi:hypothetical protein
MKYTDWQEELLYFFLDQYGGNTHNPYRDKWAMDTLGEVLTVYNHVANGRATRQLLVDILGARYVPSLLQCEILDAADKVRDAAQICLDPTITSSMLLDKEVESLVNGTDGPTTL